MTVAKLYLNANANWLSDMLINLETWHSPSAAEQSGGGE